MQSINVKHQINQPDLHDYNLSYKRMPCNTQKKQGIYDIIVNPDNIYRALIIAEETSSSPVSLYEKKIQTAINNGTLSTLDWHEKQFVGTVTCVVMESNGWRKTGKKQRFSKGLFKSAEIYTK